MQGIKKKLSRGMELYVCLHLDYFFCQTGIQVGKIAPILEQLTFVLWLYVYQVLGLQHHL